MDERELLLKGAEVIARDGWIQGHYYEGAEEPTTDETFSQWAERNEIAAQSAPVCAMGSIYRVLTGKADCGYGSPEYVLACKAEQLLLNHLHKEEGGVGRWGAVPTWNDFEGRSKEDVILAMKRAASE